ncbi:N-acetylmuramic acid 6-phosphate phosphatase [Pseudoalteromonas holothuriae]|uniref:N-acetylmuramic acid 6-phosphate phosphatase n=1 Tax=Pseudoalteromonas holothuriae TaxID=2963714 RepID=A0A9W4QY96_9GAMM|nr:MULTISPECIES: HAD-IA family hydrolase [unclassified Pseudoalteromonas]CAH9058232.1 N-acetylmuramic acid 6-phosphate phosphatase [Pseudoalteromonas sp. CIP111951]CAH9058441.1 N-acetylmuramic acid 6-phosphate phosphatase [Pseudoalteromonas sp. CIP111854]
MTQAVIFDLDGTLLDTCDDLGAALNYTLQLYGLPEVSKADYSPAISNGVKALLQVGFKDKLTDYDEPILKQSVLDYYEKNIAVHSHCFNGIAPLLDMLRSNGIKIGIMTNKPTFLTLPLLKLIDELKDIEVVVCGDTLDEAKPSPKPLLHVAQQLAVKPSECFYVGDAERDIAAAKAANMRSVAALWGYIPSKAIALSWQADLNLTNPESLFSHI